MKHLNHLKCVQCGATYRPEPRLTTCEVCRAAGRRPGILEVALDVVAVGESLRSLTTAPLSHGIRRWAGLLPLPDPDAYVSLGEGNTPLVRIDHFARMAGFAGAAFVKNETANPTGSFKDRSAVVMASMARTAGAKALTVVSSGNMGAAVSAYASTCGLRAYVIVRPTIDSTRVAQISMYGGTLVRVGGTSEDRLRFMERAIERLGWYNATSPLNPYGPEGLKTTAYELWVQLSGRVPDWVVVPVGFGCHLVGLWRGFAELQLAGLADRIPRMVGIQSEGAPSIVKAFRDGMDEDLPGVQETIAWGISQKTSPNARSALRAINATGGTAEAVSDGWIIEVGRRLAETEGLLVEPSTAAAFAGFFTLAGRGAFGRAESVVIMATGSGPRHVEAAVIQAVQLPEPLDADEDALERGWMPDQTP